MIPADLVPFSELGLVHIGIIHASVFSSFCIRGAFGFGSNLPFVLITTWIIGPHHAIVLSVVVAVFAQFHLAPQGVRSADWPVFRPLITGLLIGAFAGAAVFVSLDADWLTLIMAMLIASILLMDRYGAFSHLERLVDLRSRRVAVPLAALSGTVGSVSGGGGMYFLAAYLKIACCGARAFRGTSLMLSVVFQVGRFVALALAGLVGVEVLIESVSLLPAVFAGTWVGTRFFERSSEDRFFAAIQLVLLTGAVALMVKGALRVLA